jgi:phenylalanine-4-hydroxylase
VWGQHPAALAGIFIDFAQSICIMALGHVPLLANPVYSDFIQAYGKGGQRAMQLGMLPKLARLYWYTVEFGLIRTPRGLRIFGAGIMSSATESIFALEDPSPNRIAFNLERVMRTSRKQPKTRIDRR